MIGALRRARFAHLGTKLTVLYAGLFTIVLVAIGFAAQAMIEAHTQELVRAELMTSAQVFDRLWTMRADSLASTADVTARDFGFRSAVASGDTPTIASAVANLRARAGVSNAFLVDNSGTVTGDGPPALRATVAALPFRLESGRRDAVLASGGQVYRVIVTPILAPIEIGWVVFALHLDGSEVDGLERLSAIPLDAVILHRTADGHWRTGAQNAAGYPAEALDRFMRAEGRRQGQPNLLHLPDGAAVAVARPLASAGPEPEAVLLLSYSLAEALAPYQALETVVAAVGLAGLALLLWGSRRLAESIARPITALDDAARRLEQGERTEVPVTGVDEIGRLARSFNSMSKGILEREARIAHMAFHDPLTDLPNRAYLREQVDQALARARHAEEQLAVLCLDLDGFKGVNDTLGLPVGDALLRAMGAFLCDVAPDGIVARLSGDEFAIVLAAPFDPDRPRALCQQILDRLREPLAAAGHRIPIGTSIGIALSPGDGEDAATLIKNADLALHRAKGDGRNCFRFFEPALDAAARARRQIELDLREALTAGQLRLDYQPIFDLRRDRIRGFEALMRWDHPERGPVSPVEFIPIAEESGLIIAMGEWVVHEAAREAASWPDGLSVAVNVSPLQFRNPGFSSIVFQALTRSGLDPSRFEIEITESVFLDGAGEVVDLLHRLRSLGVRIALDDFGTGYSSLSYLRSFPFDKIKIDRSFVTPVAQDERAAAIVRAIVDLATALSMDTTAEGVEDTAQLDRLRAQGCGSIQGYLFSRPIHASQIPDLLGKAGLWDYATTAAA